MKSSSDKFVGVCERRGEASFNINNLTVHDSFIHAARTDKNRRFEPPAFMKAVNQFADERDPGWKPADGFESREHVVLCKLSWSWARLRIATGKNEDRESFRQRTA